MDDGFDDDQLTAGCPGRLLASSITVHARFVERHVLDQPPPPLEGAVRSRELLAEGLQLADQFAIEEEGPGEVGGMPAPAVVPEVLPARPDRPGVRGAKRN